MEIFTAIGAELTKEAIKEGVKEAAAEAVKEATTEASQISFGSLTDGKFKYNENYLKWMDGIDRGEVGTKWIKELTDDICDIYGVNNTEVSKKFFYGFKRFNNARIDWYGPGKSHIKYDPKLFIETGNEHGVDNILGVLSHEVGHQVFFETGLLDELYTYFEDPINKERLDKLFGHIPEPDDPEKNHSFYINEAGADYMAGLTARLGNFNPEPYLSWYHQTQPVKCTDGEHPGSSFRAEMFMRGYTRLDRGAEAKTLRTFEDFMTQVSQIERPYRDMNMLKKILEEDVVNPILKGEIKTI